MGESRPRVTLGSECENKELFWTFTPRDARASLELETASMGLDVEWRESEAGRVLVTQGTASQVVAKALRDHGVEMAP